MLETQIIEVSENEKGKVIDFYQTFGWHVLQTQKIDYTTTYMTGGGNARDGYRYTVHNDRTAYYSITFQRETKEINAEKEKLFKKYTSNRNQIAKISGDLDEINKEKMSLWLNLNYNYC